MDDSQADESTKIGDLAAPQRDGWPPTCIGVADAPPTSEFGAAVRS
jgi:hypothetical protein